MNEIRLKETLLTFAWRHLLFDKDALRTSSGETVSVIEPGVYNGDKRFPTFGNARIAIGGVTYAGDVSILEKSEDWYHHTYGQDEKFNSVILNVVDTDTCVVRRLDERLIPAVELKYSPRLRSRLATLIEGRDSCGRIMLRETNEIERKIFLQRLMVERIARKYEDIMAQYAASQESWHETFHTILFRSMGMGSNRGMFLALAHKLPYSRLCKERHDLEAMEAMIFGVAGWLDRSVYDDHKELLCERFESLRGKHDLTTLGYSEWHTGNRAPSSSIPRRMAQIAKFIHSGNLTLENVLKCNSSRHLRIMFDMELSPYWKRHTDFGKPSTEANIGDVTIESLMINLAAPMMLAYGRHTGDQALQEKALDILYDIPAENNIHTRPWKRAGVVFDNAFHSQALLQLRREYCLQERCAECFVGIKVLKKS